MSDVLFWSGTRKTRNRKNGVQLFGITHYRGGEEEGSGGKETGSREVERVLLSSSKSSVNNAGNYQGRPKKKSGDGH